MPTAPGVADALLVILRWVHALASVAFLGWTAVLWLDGLPRGDAAAAKARYKEIVEVTLLLFLATGAILSVDRLSQNAGAIYAATLALKILTAVLAYQYAFRWRRAGLDTRGADGRLILIFGGAAVLLAAVLKGIFDRAQP